MNELVDGSGAIRAAKASVYAFMLHKAFDQRLLGSTPSHTHVCERDCVVWCSFVWGACLSGWCLQ